MALLTADIAILGNGVSGQRRLSVAQRHPDLTICLIGPSGRLGSATAAAGAMLNLFGELEADTLSNPYSEKKFILGLTAARRWAAHVDWINGMVPSDYAVSIRPGTFIVNTARATELDELSFDSILAAARRFDEPFELVAANHIPGYRPAVPSRAIRAVYCPTRGRCRVRP